MHSMRTEPETEFVVHDIDEDEMLAEYHSTDSNEMHRVDGYLDSGDDDDLDE